MKVLPDTAVAGAALEERLARLIATAGPISVAQFMAEANAHYYGTRDPLGVSGDFTTAPEISQMFGELIGLWLADLWALSGRPVNVHYVELGPGRGTLAVDALRAMAKAGLVPAVELVETSPALRAAQRERLPQARWHDHPDSLPENGPLLVVANEFFDALPIRQLLATEQGWCERMVAYSGGRLAPVAGPPRSAEMLPEHLRGAPPGTIVESSPAAAAIAATIAERIAAQGGAGLFIDYGHARTGTGDTLQAVRAHRFADPWSAPGEADLTAHVDFEALAAAAMRDGIAIHGPIEQGRLLTTMGIDSRAAALARTAPDRAAEIEAARQRLTVKDQMGQTFKALAIVAGTWAQPEAFR